MSIKFYRCDDEYGRNKKDATDLIVIFLEEHHYCLNLQKGYSKATKFIYKI